MDTHSVGRSHEGRRKNNEDFIAYFEPTDSGEAKTYGSLYIVADGVGGAAKGERASQYAAQKVLFDYYQPLASSDQRGLPEPLTYLRGILKKINNEIHDYAEKNDTRMATTIVVAVIREGFLYVANVGDSRAYLIRDGNAAQVNRDHSLVGEMVEHDEMTEAEAMASSIKNRLTRSLGGDPDVSVDTYPPIRLQNGDKILLCTDGLTRYALKEKVAEMTATGTPEEIAERMVKFANDSGGADNVSVIFIAYKQELDTESPTLPAIRPRDVDLETITPTYHALPPRKARKTFADEMKWLPFAIILTLVFVVFIGFVGGKLLGMGFLVTPTQAPPKINTPLPTITLTPSITPETPTEPSPPPAEIGDAENKPNLPVPGVDGTPLTTAVNRCPEDVQIFKEASDANPANMAIAIDEKFDVTNLARGQKLAEKEDVWLEIRAGDKVGWVWYRSCIAFPSGVRLITDDGLRFESPRSPFGNP